MSKIRWIQLSDLHFGDDSPYSAKSRENFLEYLKQCGKDINYILLQEILYLQRH